MSLENNNIGPWYFTQKELESFQFKHLGKNVLIKRNVNIFNPSGISLGDNVRIEDWVLMIGSGDIGITIGANSHIASGCLMFGRGGIEIHEFCGLSPRSSLISMSDDYSGNALTGLCVPADLRAPIHGKITIGRHAILGINSTVLPKITIGEGASIGAHSLVTKDLEPWGIYFGSPAKYIRPRSQKMLELEQELHQRQI